MRIEACSTETLAQWVALRFALWPDADQERTTGEAPGMLVQPDLLVLAAREEDAVIGFAEAAIRRDYVNGCDASPVVFLEGIYVRPEQRHQGVARKLVAAVEDWAQKKGLKELASDALLENGSSHAMHKALGFSETERVVYFRKPLT